ncbi:MAG: hypothetical protein JRC86_11420, partial [Deltaproteobacteria bacterium]|nr:hypothetical protein [Deltaproteobacteria bacterium]
MQGVGFNAGSVVLTFHKYGTMLQGHGPMVLSPGSLHWPWYLFELGYAWGSKPSWHVGVLGFTVGMVMEHDTNEGGTIVGPDYRKYYWFFKGLNHQGKDLEE